MEPRSFEVLVLLNVTLTILEECNKACSVSGNHSIWIFKVSESDYQLLSAMHDIVTEAKAYKIEYFLGGDRKFLALVYGTDSVTDLHIRLYMVQVP